MYTHFKSYVFAYYGELNCVFWCRNQHKACWRRRRGRKCSGSHWLSCWHFSCEEGDFKQVFWLNQCISGSLLITQAILESQWGNKGISINRPVSISVSFPLSLSLYAIPNRQSITQSALLILSQFLLLASHTLLILFWFCSGDTGSDGCAVASWHPTTAQFMTRSETNDHFSVEGFLGYLMCYWAH